MKNHYRFMYLLIFFLSPIVLYACGKSAPPSPLYQTQSTKIQKEIQKRKKLGETSVQGS